MPPEDPTVSPVLPPLPPRLDALLADRAPDAAGMWSLRGGRVGLGVVGLLAAPDGALALVRKAERPGYAFSGLWALPGGMVRTSEGLAWGDALRASLTSRMRAEAGIEAAEVRGWRWIPLDPPPVTAYVARGVERHTLVLGLAAELPRALPVGAADPSVTDCQWVSTRGRWSELAPANRLLAAAWCWSKLDPLARQQARPALDDAAARCAGWAEQVGLPPVEPPSRWPS